MANGRCRLHGGQSTGPKTAEGRERCRTARQKHGLRGARFIALRREGLRRRKRMDALCAEGKAHTAFRHGLAPPMEWVRRLETRTTFADLIAAEVKASRAPRRAGQDPRVGYQPRGTRPLIDDLGYLVRQAAVLVRQTRAIQLKGKDPAAPPLHTVTVARKTVSSVGMGSLDDFERVPPPPGAEVRSKVAPGLPLLAIHPSQDPVPLAPLARRGVPPYGIFRRHTVPFSARSGRGPPRAGRGGRGPPHPSVPAGRVPTTPGEAACRAPGSLIRCAGQIGAATGAPGTRQGEARTCNGF
jgi:hypothetical protein